jgi:hypothetical protein
MELPNQLLALAAAVFVGVFISYVRRRFSTTDQFCELILSEIKAASERPENIGGDHCISIWHDGSKARVSAYLNLINWNTRTNGQSVQDECERYQENKVSYRYTRDHIIASLVTIYRRAKESL